MLNIPAKKRIVRAWFGDPNGSFTGRGVDVTDKVRALYGTRSVHQPYEIRATSEDFGDPLPGERKKLFVETEDYLGNDETYAAEAC